MRTRTILRPLAGAAAILVAVPALFLAILVLQPQRLLTAKVVGRALQSFGRDYRPRWSWLDFSIRSPDVFEKEVWFHATDFCFDAADGGLSGCFKSVEARFMVAFAPTGVRVTRIDLLDVQGKTLRVDGTKAPARPGPKEGFDPLRLPRLLPAFARGVSLGKLSVVLPSVELVQPGAATSGAFRLEFDPARARAAALDARWTERSGEKVHRGRARASLVSDFFKNGLLTYADADGTLEAEGARAEFSAKARQAGSDAVALDARATGRRGPLAFSFRGRGTQTPTRYAFAGELEVDLSSGPLKSLRLEKLNFTASREKGSALPVSLRLTADLKAEPIAFRRVRGFAPPRFVSGKAVLNARATPTLFQKDHFDADLSIVLNPYMSWYEAHADLFAKGSGRTSELAALRLEQRVDASLTVPRFEDLVAFLGDGPYAVPAPVSALKGGLKASFSERGDPRRDRIDFDYQMRGDLAQDRQKLKFRVDGGGSAENLLSKARSVSARVAATLDDVALQLPHLDALKMPKVTMDSRIKTARSPGPARAAPASSPDEGAAVSTSAVALELSVAADRPVVLFTDLAQTPVPVALDLKLEKPSGRLTGTVAVKSFQIEFFRRKATVEHLTLTFRPDSKKVGVDGLVKYQAAEALIEIRLLGTTDKPQVVFESDPPLSQSDIIAMLVFGKSPNELDADQATTVANAQTAMSDEAFGLASLYFLASTPIQFMGYDPAAKSYTMEFRVPGGETLRLNSDFDSTKSVQLRKRLSKHFAVEAEAVNSPTRGNGVVTFLEWFTRY